MRLIKTGLASIDSALGAFKTNTDKIINYASKMAGEKCTIGCFPEQSIAGYPCEDLVQWSGFVKGQWTQLERFAETTKTFNFPTVFVVGLTVELNGNLYNSAAVVCYGNILGIVPKEKLPTYDVFYESRTFSRCIPWHEDLLHKVPIGDYIFKFPFGIMAVEICEDIWAPDGPMERRTMSGAEVVVNISASPWRSSIENFRKDLITTRAADKEATIIYVNKFGGQDSLVFDGGGFINQNGKMVIEAKRWCETLTTHIVDLDVTSLLRKENTTWRGDQELFLRENPPVSEIFFEDGPLSDEPEYKYPIPPEKSFFVVSDKNCKPDKNEYFDNLILAMRTGLASYFEKTGVFEGLCIALSGGKDSVMTLIISWLYAKEKFKELPEDEQKKAVKGFIRCYSMPTHFNSETTKGISRNICEELGVSFKELSIEDAFEREVEEAEKMLSLGEKITKNTMQNIQARIRGSRMWNVANSASLMWLQTGNMSEKAVGYTTIGGDMMGAYSLIGNLPKTLLIELLAYIGEKYKINAVTELLKTKASAELSDNQEDEKDLMAFPVLDACFALFAGKKMMPADLYTSIRSMWTDEELKAMRPDYTKGILKVWVKRFLRLFISSIFKWVQMPQAVHLGALDLDRERALQLPVVQSMEWLDIDSIDNLSD